MRPLTPAGVLELVADLAADRRPGHPVRVGVDGAPAAAPAEFADALIGPLRLRGRPVIRVGAADFLRPASVRLERGRTDPDAWYELSLDAAGLLREVLEPLGPGGSGRYLPSLWDAAADRATRADYVQGDPAAVLLVDGALLLRPPLREQLDLAVHLHLGPGALARRTGPEQAWTLPAFTRYEREHAPARSADVVVRVDDPRHPAVLERR